jgi:hypothetical protein
LQQNEIRCYCPRALPWTTPHVKIGVVKIGVAAHHENRDDPAVEVEVGNQPPGRPDAPSRQHVLTT